MNRKNITRFAFAIVIICFFLSTFVSLWSLRIMVRQNMQALSKTIAARIYDAISGELSEPITVSKTMANDYFLIDALRREPRFSEGKLEKQLADYLSGICDGLECETAFVVSDASRHYYSYAGVNKRMDLENSDRDQWYVQFVQGGAPYELDVDRDEVSQDMWTVFVDARVEDKDGTLLGVCGVGARMTGTQALFRRLERDYDVKINLIDADGLIHVDTDESKLEKAYLEGVRISDTDDYVFQPLGGGRSAVTKYLDRLGWYLVVQGDGSAARNQFINVLLLNVVLCVAVLVIMILVIRIIATRTRALQQASFTAQSTRLLNRRAFEEEKARLSMLPLRENFTYITADVNGLKAVNDTQGHAAGDELIQGAADCLRGCFGRYGDIYRIGGDEFAGMLNLSQGQLEEAMRSLDDATARWAGKLAKELSISCGCASVREFPSENLTELSRISDERMYAAKEAHYKATGKQRRR